MRLPRFWPFRPERQRADSSYTDALVQAIQTRANGQQTAFPTATAALEACTGFVGRAFGIAEVDAPPVVSDLLTPDCMTLIGRSLIRRGELILYMATNSGRLELLPCASHDIDGGPMPDSWSYRCTVSGPERTWTYNDVPASGVLHFTYSVDPETPWKGQSPLQVAALAGRLSAETVNALANESGGPVGHFLPLPVDGQDATLDALKNDIRTARGKILTVEGGDWDNAGGGRDTNYQALRFGASPPDSLVEVQKTATAEVYAACGINPSVFMDSQGTAAREAYRQALFATVAPLGALVQSELSRKLETDVTLDWVELRASDVQGRARAFQSMVGGGMEVEKAAALSGLMVSD